MLCTIAVNNFAGAIEYAPHPSEELQMTAVLNSASSIRYIDAPVEAVQRIAISDDARCLKYIHCPESTLILEATTEMLKDNNIEDILEAIQNIGEDKYYAALTDDMKLAIELLK